MKYVKLPKREMTYLLVAGGLLVAYFIYRNSRIRKLKVPINPDAEPTRSGFNPLAEAKMIRDELLPVNVDMRKRNEVFDHILTFNENELRQVHNAYLVEYRGEKKETLAELVRQEWVMPWEWWSGTQKKQKEILNRLRAIGAA